jgi:hypothetical protein
MRIVLAVAAALALAGCPGKPASPELGREGTEGANGPPPPAANGPRERIPVLVCVGETLGWLEPCGCTDGMLGGIARRAAFLGQLKARGFEPIVLDMGDLVSEPGRQSELKLEALAAAYERMAPIFVARGERDLAVEGSIRRLSPANLDTGEAAPGTLAAPGLSRPLFVQALLSPSFAADVEAQKPARTLGDPTVARGDILIYHGPRDEARRLFRDRKDVLLVFAGHGEEVPPPPERLPGGAWLVSAGDKGKYAVVVELARGERGALDLRPWPPAPLDDRVPDDPEVARIVETYKDRLFEENLVALAEQKPPESGGFFVGPETCGSCHKKEFGVFQKMKHAHAYESLRPRRGERNPECLRCHVTGFGFETGFRGIEETPGLACVSCESCHGVGSNHIANPQPGFGALKEPAALCVRCHDRENSPRFDFATYWPKIRH